MLGRVGDGSQPVYLGEGRGGEGRGGERRHF